MVHLGPLWCEYQILWPPAANYTWGQWSPPQTLSCLNKGWNETVMIQGSTESYIISSTGLFPVLAYFWMAFKIPHMYWSTSSPSNSAVLLSRGEKQCSKYWEAEAVYCSLIYKQSKYWSVLQQNKLTCRQDIATSPAHSSVVNMIPNQNTARRRKKSNLSACTLF